MSKSVSDKFVDYKDLEEFRKEDRIIVTLSGLFTMKKIY